jgi:hypothetical protein
MKRFQISAGTAGKKKFKMIQAARLKPCLGSGQAPEANRPRLVKQSRDHFSRE